MAEELLSVFDKLQAKWLILSIPYVSRVLNRRNFWFSDPRKKIRFSYGNLRLTLVNFDNRILKKGLFHRVKELFKSNQTRHGVSHVYLKCKIKRVFAIACLGKKLDFHTGICD